jgi:GNAT superfamily N-acetyltransferase
MKSALPLPVFVATASGPVKIRRAIISDLERVLDLLGDDPISAGRGDFSSPDHLASAQSAFAAIEADPGNAVVVVERSGEVVATMQLTIIPGLSRGGATRLQVEAVHVASDLQSGGIGTAMMRWVIDQAAPALEIRLIQLTSDASRANAHRFYRRLGFVDSHLGFKLRTTKPSCDPNGR